ncbi:MAG: sn-glycerol-3-phosphate ABC transporter ATP-binding protein UgpC [Clostridia bacterium]|jgi:multiple sugar transport system ATP-binding protein|nr:sn-glycerol-3-phosphate ABC transporter ATP-binding protein UgpC [Clostridia bacterium]
MANLKLSHIYKVYDNGHKAVNDFSIDIADREFIVFVGPSGCGKSTTLRMIAGLETITAGDLLIGDTLVNDMEPKDRDIAMVFQSYALYPHMTVYENMAFGLRNRKMPEKEIKERVLKAAKILDIEDYLDRKPKAMSGGQRQRVALGRALVRDPKVFLLDEPLSNLDAKLRAAMRTEITALHKSLNTTFIYVTHDQVEAMTMGTRIVVMKLGYVQQIDTPMNLYNQPYNKFVAGFIGTPQMNFFDVTLKREHENVLVNFPNGDKVTVPYENVSKIHNHYLNGDVTVTFGIRPEHILVNKEGRGLKFVVTNVENLGNDSIIYGKLGDHLGEFTMKEEGNGIVVKVMDVSDIEVGDVIYAEPNPAKVHFFDAETEVTLMNKIPPYNTLEAVVDGENMTVLGTKVALPEEYRKALGGADRFDLIVPPHAIVKGNDFALKVARIEKVDNDRLAYLVNGESYLFALVGEDVKVGDMYGFSFENQKLNLNVNDVEVLKAVEDEVSLMGTFSKKEIRENHDRVLHFFYHIGDYTLEALPEHGYKINSIDGDNCYKYTYRYAIDRNALRLAEEGEPALEGRVVEYCDYGNIRFAKIEAAGQEFLLTVDPDFEAETVRVAMDSHDVSVYSTRIEMKIC